MVTAAGLMVSVPASCVIETVYVRSAEIVIVAVRCTSVVFSATVNWMDPLPCEPVHVLPGVKDGQQPTVIHP